MFKPLIVAAAALALAAPAAIASPALAQTFETSGYPKCNAGVLSFIPPIVRREAVAAVKPGAHVSVHQICRGYELNDFGNAAGLTRTIAANPTLAARWQAGAGAPTTSSASTSSTTAASSSTSTRTRRWVNST